MAKATYKDAGVDLEIYEQSMARLPRHMHRTLSPRVMKLAGGFAGLFQLDFENPLFRRNYEEPVLISCTDGVGTKLKLATQMERHNTVGIDLVAMSVNDAICCGAEPLFFLDYVAMSHDDPVRLEQIVEGIAEGCVQANCALIGGETAIMPDIYSKGEYDLAGFCVGVAEKKQLIKGDAISKDDVILALGSSGFHSNGYSLIRKVVSDAGLKPDDRVEELDESVGDVLLRPTRIYVPVVQKILRTYKVKQVVHGISHITGGGLEENLARILPPNRTATIDYSSWDPAAPFQWLQRLGDIDRDEMFRVFNMGIGLVLVVSPFYAPTIQKMAQDEGIECWVAGKIS